MHGRRAVLTLSFAAESCGYDHPADDRLKRSEIKQGALSTEAAPGLTVDLALLWVGCSLTKLAE